MADEKSTGRLSLAAFFQAGDIPEERHFTALIHSGINQVDDGLTKSPTDPLRVQAPINRSGDSTNLLELFEDNLNGTPNWSVSLRQDTRGLLISQGDGSGDGLFIDEKEGFVGIGTQNPSVALQVDGDVKADSFIGTIQPESGTDKGLVFTGSPAQADGPAAKMLYYESGKGTTLEIQVAGGASDHILLQPSGKVGIKTSNPTADLEVNGTAKATAFSGLIRPTAGNTNNNGILFPLDPGGGRFDAAWIRYYARTGENTTLEIGVDNDAQDHIALIPSGNVGIGTNAPEAKLDVRGHIRSEGGLELSGELPGNTGLKLKLANGFGLGKKGTTLFYAANGSHSWRDGNATDERMALATGANGGLAVKGTGVSSFAGSLAVGRAAVASGLTLEVNGHAKAASFQGQIRPTAGSSADAGILFPRDPGGGSGDAAWIRYYPRSGEATLFEIGTSNDANDHIVLRPNRGNVGIGSSSFIPQFKLDVEGPIRGSSFVGQFQPSGGSSANDGIIFPKDPGGGSGDAAWIRYFARKGEETTLEIGVSNDSNDHITLKPSGNVGIGVDVPSFKLEVNGHTKATSFQGQLRPSAGNSENDGILFPKDPGRGSGDAAWIRYYPRSGEATLFEIGTSNDADDHIVLRPNRGNVGIGNDSFIPAVKLDVEGPIRATSFMGPLRPTAGNSANHGILFPKNPGGGSGDASWIRYYPRSGEATLFEIGTSNDSNDHIVLRPNLGNVGIGNDGFIPEFKLDVQGAVRATSFIGAFTGQLRPSAGNSDSDGIVFPRDPGGGSGDAAWIRYYPRSGEATTFEIGTSNDSNDHIVLRPNRGNVGIGNDSFIPEVKLDVEGPVKATGFRIGGTTLTEDDLKVLKSLANGKASVHVNFDTGIFGISSNSVAAIHIPR